VFETGFATTNLDGKCHNCKHYEPFIKSLYKLKQVKTCRGHCLITKNSHGGYRYKQRTETCVKWKGVK